MMNTQNEFIQSLNGEIPTPQQAAQLLEMTMQQGDTGTQPDTSGAPTTATDEGAGTQAGDAGKTGPNDEGMNADNTVIMAKDGKHTIGYDKLVDARKGEQHWKSQFDAANAELAALRAQAEARAASGQAPTGADVQVATAQAAIDAGANPDIFGDFSEEAIAKGIQTLVDAKVEAIVAQKLEPIQKKQANEEADQHYNAIYSKHPDADSLVESKELADWIGSQPSFVQAGYKDVLDKGTTDQVIELFDRFKQATGSAQARAESQDEIRARAKSAVAQATPAVPASLSDFPGGRAGGVTRDEVMAGMNGPDMLEAMADMTPQQIDAYLNRRL